MFRLSGSQKFVMMKTVPESLAVRVAVFDLLPLSYNEMTSDIKDFRSRCFCIGIIQKYKSMVLSNNYLDDTIFVGYNICKEII